MSIIINRSCLVFIASRLHGKRNLKRLSLAGWAPSALLILLQMHLARVFEAKSKEPCKSYQCRFRFQALKSSYSYICPHKSSRTLQPSSSKFLTIPPPQIKKEISVYDCFSHAQYVSRSSQKRSRIISSKTKVNILSDARSTTV